MNWVDIAIFGLLVFFVIESLGKGFLSETLDFFGFFTSFFVSLRFYNTVAFFYESNFQIPHSVALVMGFVTVWFLVESILFSIVHVLMMRSKYLTTMNHYLRPLAPIPAFLRGVIFVSILLVLIGTFPIQPQAKIAIEESKLGSLILVKTQQLETPLKNVFGGITQDTLTFLTIKPKSDETVNLGFTTEKYVPNHDLELQMYDLVNQERESRGLKRLEYTDTLQSVGRNHSADMFSRGYFSHYSPEQKTVADRVEAVGYDYMVVGENLAYAPDLQLAHTGLMNSEGHRANILSKDYGKIGIGIMDGGVYGLMVTQVFSN